MGMFGLVLHEQEYGYEVVIPEGWQLHLCMAVLVPVQKDGKTGGGAAMEDTILWAKVDGELGDTKFALCALSKGNGLASSGGGARQCSLRHVLTDVDDPVFYCSGPGEIHLTGHFEKDPFVMEEFDNYDDGDEEDEEEVDDEMNDYRDEDEMAADDEEDDEEDEEDDDEELKAQLGEYMKDKAMAALYRQAEKEYSGGGKGKQSKGQQMEDDGDDEEEDEDEEEEEEKKKVQKKEAGVKGKEKEVANGKAKSKTENAVASAKKEAQPRKEVGGKPAEAVPNPTPTPSKRKREDESSSSKGKEGEVKGKGGGKGEDFEMTAAEKKKLKKKAKKAKVEAEKKALDEMFNAPSSAGASSGKGKEGAEGKGSGKDGKGSGVPLEGVPLPKPIVRTLTGGLVVKDKVLGTGKMAQSGKSIQLLYEGSFPNGKTFDKNWNRKKPLSFRVGLGQVVKGMDRGVEGMKVGGQRELLIPAALAYGKHGTGPIPANQDLVFHVELIGVK